MDAEGIELEALAEACKKAKPKALYLNPTLQNPTTLTIPDQRRRDIADVARRFKLADRRGRRLWLHSRARPCAVRRDRARPDLARRRACQMHRRRACAPPMSWCPIRGRPGRSRRRCAPPTSWPRRSPWRWRRAGSRTAPPTRCCASSGTRPRARQKLVAEILPKGMLQSDPLSFNIWVELPRPWTRAAFRRAHALDRNRRRRQRRVCRPSGAPPEAVRVCLGGPIARPRLAAGLEYMAHALTESPALASAFL